LVVGLAIRINKPDNQFQSFAMSGVDSVPPKEWVL